MSSYQRWNLQELRQNGIDNYEAGASGEGLADERPLSSFTPINPISAHVQFISPDRTLHAAGLDGYGTLELPQEELDPPVSKTKKRSRAQVTKGRAVSIGGLWQYVDEGDLAGQINGDDFQDTFSKRRKPGPVKRSNSSKAPTNTRSQFWQHDESQVAGPNENEDGQQASQLTTPPDFGNKKKKRVTSAKNQASKSKMPAFKMPTVTKLAVSREKDAVEEAVRTQPKSRYLGYVTTQDTFKLAKTTLEKLAAFWYVPPAASQQRDAASTKHPEIAHSEVETNVHANPGEESFDHEILGDFVLAENEPHEGRFDESADYEDQFVQRDSNVPLEQIHVAGQNPFFAVATLNIGVSSQPQYGGQLGEQGHQLVSSAAEQRYNIQHASQKTRPIKFDHSNMLFQWKGDSMDGSLHDIPTTKSQNFSQYDEPTSSSTRAVLNLLETPHTAHTDCENLLEQSSGILGPSLNNLSASQGLNQVPEALHNVTGTQPPQDTDNPKELSSQVLPVLCHDWQQKHHPDPSRNIRVERSDVDDIDIAMVDASKDYDIDSYDEGLDDSDLMALASQPIVPATQPVLLPDQLPVGDSTDLPQKQSETGRVENFQKISGNSTSNGNQQRPIAYSRPSSLLILNSEINDEFLLDDEIEEEMMKVPELNTGVIERHPAPASVQHPSTSGEVYDKSLQFSPPRSSSAALYTGKARIHQTDKNSAISSPSKISELSAGNEEDWSFIRSNDEYDAEEHRAGSRHFIQAAASPDEAEEVMLTRSQARPVIKPAYRGQSSTGQKTTATITTILDDCQEYEPLKPFARPDFPILIQDRSPVVGLSPQAFLRVCFRVGEMLKEGARCVSLKQGAVIELFARVTHSSREPGTTKQHFQFADLWHDRPPFPNGILANYRPSGLAESESRIFIGAQDRKMARCFGRLKRDSRNATGWLLDIITIRPTDWEELRWTKGIVSAGLVKSEAEGPSKL